jgi:hypothetical protein
MALLLLKPMGAFYYLKGGWVDYSEEHNDACGHARFGRTYARAAGPLLHRRRQVGDPPPSAYALRWVFKGGVVQAAAAGNPTCRQCCLCSGRGIPADETPTRAAVCAAAAARTELGHEETASSVSAPFDRVVRKFVTMEGDGGRI